MIEELEKQPHSEVHLVNLMVTGPTHESRKTLWMEISGAAAQMRDNAGYFQQLLRAKSDMTSVFTSQVEEDLERTYSNEPIARSHLFHLRNVLIAYSWRNPSIGYCQGMNYIASRFLSFGLSEEESFWLLAQVVETYLPLDYFSVMTGVQTDQRVFECLLKQMLPKVAQHLQKLQVDSHMYVVQWLLTMFAYTFPREVVIRIWDLFFAERSSVLLRIGLSLLSLSKAHILRTNSAEACIDCIKEVAIAVTDPEELISTACLDKFHVKEKQLRALRETFRAQTMQEMDSRSPLKLPKGELLSMIARPCTELDCKLKLRKTASFLVLRTDSILVIEDYIGKLRAKTPLGLGRRSCDLVLGRKSHDCAHDEVRSVRKSKNPFPMK